MTNFQVIPDLFLNAPRMTMMHNSVRPPEAVRKDPNFKSMIRMLLNMDNPASNIECGITCSASGATFREFGDYLLALREHAPYQDRKSVV